jgi:hypothetical protein
MRKMRKTGKSNPGFSWFPDFLILWVAAIG